MTRDDIHVYVQNSIRFYNKYKGNDSVAWATLDQILKDVLVDMKYQGSLEINMITVFGKNEKNEVIKLIKNSAKLSNAERARQRIPYIERGMK